MNKIECAARRLPLPLKDRGHEHANLNGSPTPEPDDLEFAGWRRQPARPLRGTKFIEQTVERAMREGDLVRAAGLLKLLEDQTQREIDEDNGYTES